MAAQVQGVQAERLARAFAVLERAEEKTAPAARPHGVEHALETSPAFPIPSALSGVLPARGLRAGSSLAVSGPCASSLALSVAAAAMGSEHWCALVGMPHVGLGALDSLGLDATRTALVPALGPRPAVSLAALVDGISILVLGADLELSAATWRALSARARTQRSLLIRVQPRSFEVSAHARCDLELGSAGVQWTGLAHGSGRLRFRTAFAHAAGRGILGTGKRTAVRVPALSGALSPLPCSSPRVAIDREVRRPALTLVKGER